MNGQENAGSSMSDLERRIRVIERRTDDDGVFLRSDIFKLNFEALQNDVADIKADLAKKITDDETARATEAKIRTDDRRSIRNLVTAALLSAVLAIAVALIVAALNVGGGHP